ncbi:hypothetical protein WM30_24540 [Burkholderia ubonensis]|nr:hypothetical protein WM30_24540 [Burkholderia ubonensis]
MNIEVICHISYRVRLNHLLGELDLIWRQGTWTTHPLTALTGCRHPRARAFRDQSTLEFR